MFHRDITKKVFRAIVLPGPSAILFDLSKFPSPSRPAPPPPLSLYLDPQNLLQIQMYKALSSQAHDSFLTIKYELELIQIKAYGGSWRVQNFQKVLRQRKREALTTYSRSRHPSLRMTDSSLVYL